jgi:hypothetical protein
LWPATIRQAKREHGIAGHPDERASAIIATPSAQITCRPKSWIVKFHGEVHDGELQHDQPDAAAEQEAGQLGAIAPRRSRR